MFSSYISWFLTHWFFHNVDVMLVKTLTGSASSDKNLVISFSYKLFFWISFFFCEIRSNYFTNFYLSQYLSQNFPLLLLYIKSVLYFHCLKKVCILSFLVRMSASPYSLRMRENTDQKNLKYGHFLRSIYFFVFV